MIKIRNIFKRIFGIREEKSSFISVFQVDDKKSGDLLGYVKAKTYESVTAGDMTKHKKTVTYYGFLTPVFECSLLCKRFDTTEPHIEYLYTDFDDRGKLSLYSWYMHIDHLKLTRIYDYEEFTFEYV